ncbi:transmembrane emp24 domain-containing protein 1-like [Echeneis naucrates]|uniref:transmembrane emp24 domain-containing protein 1-like n=1 Tax=Echeneis naucrates TaxID=173247 RepID=UPI0011135CAE|nr:transmembrane emp24 domain-containing protein 1-like [Echeneis naucrates]
MLCSRMMMDPDVPAQLCLLACFILTVDLAFALGPNQNIEFTFLLPAGSTECFYQTTKKNGIMEVEYQVIAGSGLDVGFALIAPSGHRLASDFRRSEGIHTVDPTEDGDYRLCFDNSFSKLSEKMVFFEVLINRQSSTGRGEWADVAAEETMVEYKLEDIKAKMDLVYQHLERSRQVQALLRAFEARDRYLLEDSLWRVTFWSSVNLLVMLAVAATQIYTLRRLFDGTKRTRT